MFQGLFSFCRPCGLLYVLACCRALLLVSHKSPLETNLKLTITNAMAQLLCHDLHYAIERDGLQIGAACRFLLYIDRNFAYTYAANFSTVSNIPFSFWRTNSNSYSHGEAVENYRRAQNILLRKFNSLGLVGSLVYLIAPCTQEEGDIHSAFRRVVGSMPINLQLVHLATGQSNFRGPATRFDLRNN
jgi:hypothetical protein